MDQQEAWIFGQEAGFPFCNPWLWEGNRARLPLQKLLRGRYRVSRSPRAAQGRGRRRQETQQTGQGR